MVIDAGYNEGSVGDVAFAEAVSVAGLITPVPGGVGPTTIALLIEQTISAAEEAQSALLQRDQALVNRASITT